MNAATSTDWVAMGLGNYQPHQNAFTAVPPKGAYRPYVAPKKHGPKLTKVQQAAISLETPEERRERLARSKMALDQQGRARVDLAPRKTGAITIYLAADQNRNRALAHGRAI